jgi:hypothetical protein
VKKRLAVLLLILGLAPVVATFAWPRVDKQAITADLHLAVQTQPRAEVIASGSLKNLKATAFSVETLMIEEPGKEPYRKLVSLDANRMFELALGNPVAGTYRISARTRKANWQGQVTEGWLKTPELVVGRGPATPQVVRATDYDYRRLLVLLSVMIVVEAGVLVVWLRRRIAMSKPVPTPN